MLRSVSTAPVQDALIVGEHLPGLYQNGSIGLITDENYIIRIQIVGRLPLKQFHIIHFPAGQKIPDSNLSLRTISCCPEKSSVGGLELLALVVRWKLRAHGKF